METTTKRPYKKRNAKEDLVPVDIRKVMVLCKEAKIHLGELAAMIGRYPSYLSEHFGQYNGYISKTEAKDIADLLGVNSIDILYNGLTPQNVSVREIKKSLNMTRSFAGSTKKKVPEADDPKNALFTVTPVENTVVISDKEINKIIETVYNKVCDKMLKENPEKQLQSHINMEDLYNLLSKIVAGNSRVASEIRLVRETILELFKSGET